MKRVTLALVALALVSCAHGNRPPAGATVAAVSGRFHYDARAAKCVDAAGRPGFNAFNPAALFPGGPKVRRVYVSGNAECVDFSGFDFSRHIGLGYTSLEKWNFRGARFTKARFMFANMIDADIKGADMSGLRFGYTEITGRGDANTKWPKGLTCKVQSYKLSCRQ